MTFLESDVDRDGGRIVLVAGAPQTFGDDEERLLRTLRAAVDAGLPLPVHVGASRGRVFTGQVGATFRRTYTILGDTAALAARLMARAGEDEIWVAAEAFARAGTHFEGTELEPLPRQGQERAGARRRARRHRSGDRRAAEAEPRKKLPFVDRERERAVLGASVAPVRMGFGTLVELVGEPGIGKSRLADELRDNCADMQLLTARCDQYESSTPYSPVPAVPALAPRRRAQRGRRAQPRPCSRSGSRRSTASSCRGRRCSPHRSTWRWSRRPRWTSSTRRSGARACTASSARCSGSCSTSPTLLVFEDVHWMDDASSELLRHLGTQLADEALARRARRGAPVTAASRPPKGRRRCPR